MSNLLSFNDAMKILGVDEATLKNIIYKGGIKLVQDDGEMKLWIPGLQNYMLDLLRETCKVNKKGAITMRPYYDPWDKRDRNE